MPNYEKGIEVISQPELITPTFAEALKFWIKLGFISFGGPAGQIALMHHELVERKRWIDDESYLHALNFCMLLPGPEAQQLATYNGWKLHGAKGGLAAGLFFILPSVFILLALSYIYARFGNVREVSAVLDGLKPVVVAIVVEAVWKLGKKAFKNWLHVAIAALAFVAIFALHIPFPLIVLGAGFIGYLADRKLKVESQTKVESRKSKVESQIQESQQIRTEEQADSAVQKLKTQNSKLKTLTSKPKTIKTIAVFASLWLIPFVSSGLYFGWQSLPTKIYLFFTQAAFVTFGGAYAVLAYVNQAMVNSYGWITATQAIDSFALAETTPGPLIMVLQNIGFLAGWNNHGEMNQTWFAIICGLLATFATFLPSFMFIFIGAPYLEKLRGNQKLNAALSGVTASVVGVILNLALAFGIAVIFPNGFSGAMNWFGLIISSLAFVVLFRFKIDVLWLVFIGGSVGLLKVLIFGN